jgi:ADP-ribose pyrophosphatase YjhB (NUDIX family)
MLDEWLRAKLLRRRGRGRRCRWPGPPARYTARFSVGAAALIRDREGRILLIQQTYRRSDVWLPPGGWVGADETPREAAAREVLEEVGLRVAVGRPLAVGTGGYGELNLLFECELLGDPILSLSAEIERADFFKLDALPPLAEQTKLWLAEALALLAAKPHTDSRPRS